MDRIVLLLFAIALIMHPGVLRAKDSKGKAAPESSTSALPITDVEKEDFLRSAKIVNKAGTKKGITNTLRVTMFRGGAFHDAHVQCIDEAKREFRTDRGIEINFKDTYRANIAAYRLARMLGIENVPVTVQRRVDGKDCAVDWWIDDVQMDEAQRRKQKLEPPDPGRWNNQIHVMRVFDQLVCNVDRNLTNLLILKNWDIVLIDYSRSFRLQRTLDHKNLALCDRTLLQNLRALDSSTVHKGLEPYCTKSEVDAVMARRELIVEFFDDLVKQKGESAVLYDSKKIRSMASRNQ